jgi:hypothetical protein
MSFDGLAHNDSRRLFRVAVGCLGEYDWHLWADHRRCAVTAALASQPATVTEVPLGATSRQSARNIADLISSFILCEPLQSGAPATH